jgi:hypothetical protein
MANERKWFTASVALSVDGTAQGKLTVSDASGFYVKSKIRVTSNTQPALSLEIKRIEGTTDIYVGDITADINHRVDMSAYLVADSAAIVLNEQIIPTIKPEDIRQAIYAREPIVADRNVLVDKYGRYYDGANPIPVEFKEPVDVRITSAPSSTTNTKSIFAEVPAIAAGSETIIVSYTVPASKIALLQRVTYSGGNIAEYRLYVNGTLAELKRTNFGSDLSGEMTFIGAGDEGPKYVPGDVLVLKILHARPYTASFNGRIQIVEIG